MQIDDFIRNLAAKQVEATFDEKKEELAHVPKATIDKQKKDLIEQNFIILKAQLSKQLEIKLSGNETFELVVFEFLDNVYQKLDVSINKKRLLISQQPFNYFKSFNYAKTSSGNLNFKLFKFSLICN